MHVMKFADRKLNGIDMLHKVRERFFRVADSVTAFEAVFVMPA